MNDRRASGTDTVCAHCAQQKTCSRMILEELVCWTCLLRFRRDPRTCPGCTAVKVLAFYDPNRQPVCAACAGADPVFACPRCGREDSPYGRHCGPCTLAERAAALLADSSGAIHPQLQPIFDTLLAGPRPQSALYWFTRSSGPDILRAMARGDLPISHTAFADLPTTRTEQYVRDLLVATGVLPAYHAELERIPPWLDDLLATLPKDHADVVNRFARWHLLRRLRHQEQTGTATHGAINGARGSILATIRFLRWLQEHHTSIGALTLTDLEHYAAEHPARAPSLAGFLTWTASTGLTNHVKLPSPQRTMPNVTVSDDHRWAHVDLLLHDDTIRLYTRVAGLFTLLFAQPLARICRMRTNQITIGPDGQVSITLDTVPIRLPEILDQLVVQHLQQRGQASYVSHPDHWLFPGGIPGRHLATENVRGQLVQRGIHPSTARNAALFQLAGAMPSAVLADILHIAPVTASRWAALAGQNWSQYTAHRAAAMAPDGR